MALYTQKAIMRTFQQMLEEMPFDKITVSALVRRCEISPNTFYYHYQDIPSLIEEVIKEETDNIISQYPTISAFEECLKIAVEFALKNKKAVFHVYNSTNRNIFEHYLWNVCQYVVLTYINTVFSDYQVVESDKNVIVKFYKCEIFGQIIWWLDSGMQDDLLESSQRLCELRKGMTEELFRRSSDNQ